MSDNSKLSNAEIASFCSQLSLLLQAGIAPSEGIAIIRKDTTDSKAIELLDCISEELDKGENFYTAMSKTQKFPDYALNMIKLGEVSGNLDDVVASLGEYYDRENEISIGIKNAITYPVIMLLMMIVILVVLVTKVLPIFSQVFEQLGSELTGFSRSLLLLGNTLNRYAIGIVVVLAALVIIFLILFKTPKGQVRRVKFLSSFPMTAKLYEKIGAGRFASGMAMALESGLDIFSSLELVRGLVEQDALIAKIDACKNSLEKGEQFGDALMEAGIFSSLYGRMVSIGFKTGTTDKVMRKIASSYEEEVNERISNIISVIEPTLVIVLSIIVGVILLSVILPLMGVMTTIG